MIKGSPNLLNIRPGRGLGCSHNAIWGNLAIFFYVQAENSRPKDGWTGLCMGPCMGHSMSIGPIFHKLEE